MTFGHGVVGVCDRGHGFCVGRVQTYMNHDIIKAVETMTAALVEGDLDRVMASYEPSATIFFEPGVAVSDAAEQRSLFAALAGMGATFSYPHGHEAWTEGDLGIHIAPWTMSGRAPDGSIVEQQGLSIAVLRRQASGSWLMVLDNPHGGRLL